jgi:hypothetical protein
LVVAVASAGELRLEAPLQPESLTGCVLVNGVLRLLLDKATGRFCGLRDVRSGRRYLPDGIPFTLFELETKDEKDPAVARLSSDDAKLTATMLDGRKL